MRDKARRSQGLDSPTTPIAEKCSDWNVCVDGLFALSDGVEAQVFHVTSPKILAELSGWKAKDIEKLPQNIHVNQCRAPASRACHWHAKIHSKIAVCLYMCLEVPSLILLVLLFLSLSFLSKRASHAGFVPHLGLC